MLPPETSDSLPDDIDVPLDRMVFDDEHCFICGRELGPKRTMEHIFPKWLLNQFDLWNHSLTLINRTDIPYRKLTVPACARCNNEGLAAIEDEVSTAVAEGYHAVAALDPLTLFQWAGKILFGLLFKELSLHADRRDPEKGTILTPANLKGFSVLHDLLQSIHTPFRFPTARPFSVLVANLHEYSNAPFDFADNYFHETIALRLGTVGIIVCCLDHGFTEGTFGRYLEEIGGQKLHPIQFDELYVQTVYQRKRLTRSPKLMFATQTDPPQSVDVITMPLAGLSSLPLVEPGDEAELAEWLWAFWEKWGIPWDAVYTPEEGLRTLMFASEDELLLLGPDMEQIGTVKRPGAG